MNTHLTGVSGRPRAVWLGIPYLALPWFVTTGYLALDQAGLLTAVEVVTGSVVTMAWGALLDRAWRGRPLAVQVLALLGAVVAGGQLLFLVIIPGMSGLALGLGGEPDTLLAFLDPWFLGFAVVNALGLAAGLALRKARVVAWSEARHPIQTPPGGAAGGPEDATPEN